MWSCKLQRDFPERRFKVEIHDGEPGDLLSYEITFFQDRDGPQTRFVRLHPEITLTDPDFDEVCDFTSLLIRLRDRADRGQISLQVTLAQRMQASFTVYE
jgi:hypothetical protein